MATGTHEAPGSTPARGPSARWPYLLAGALALTALAWAVLEPRPLEAPRPAPGAAAPSRAEPLPAESLRIRVEDTEGRPVPHARVRVRDATGAPYAPGVEGATDLEGAVTLEAPGSADGHRIEVLPSVLVTATDDGVTEVVPFDRAGPDLATTPEGRLRGWYAQSFGPWRGGDPPVRVRPWVRARLRVVSAPAERGGTPVPAAGVTVALWLGGDAPDRFFRLTTTDVEGRASFWLWSREPVDVIALSNAIDRLSAHVTVGPDAPQADVHLADRHAWLPTREEEREDALKEALRRLREERERPGR